MTKGVLEMSRFNLQLFDEGNLKDQSVASLKRGIRTFTKRIAEHQYYIENPHSHCPDWERMKERDQRGQIRHWNKEIDNFKESICNMVKELEKRGEFDA